MPKVFSRDRPNPQLFLRLVESYGNADLVIVDEDGRTVDRGTVARITANGVLQLYPHVDADAAKKVGIKLGDRDVIDVQVLS